jgi:Holliday junction resolvasome RuvABC endonuclease subunit
MTPAKVILGVDPGLRATGLAAIALDESADVAPQLVMADTVKPCAKGELIDRLMGLEMGVTRFLEEFWDRVVALRPPGAGLPVLPVEIVIEDATALRSRGLRGGPRMNAVSSARLGAAVGVVMLTMKYDTNRGSDWPVYTYTVDEWIPKARRGRGGNWTGPVRHDRVVAFYRQLEPALKPATDDEVMAYALAMFHRERTR